MNTNNTKSLCTFKDYICISIYYTKICTVINISRFLHFHLYELKNMFCYYGFCDDIWHVIYLVIPVVTCLLGADGSASFGFFSKNHSFVHCSLLVDPPLSPYLHVTSMTCSALIGSSSGIYELHKLLYHIVALYSQWGFYVIEMKTVLFIYIQDGPQVS
jgi:hypothetical protein